MGSWPGECGRAWGRSQRALNDTPRGLGFTLLWMMGLVQSGQLPEPTITEVVSGVRQTAQEELQTGGMGSSVSGGLTLILVLLADPFPDSCMSPSTSTMTREGLRGSSWQLLQLPWLESHSSIHLLGPAPAGPLWSCLCVCTVAFFVLSSHPHSCCPSLFPSPSLLPSCIVRSTNCFAERQARALILSLPTKSLCNSKQVTLLLRHRLGQ
jgi:hypothetical protein